MGKEAKASANGEGQWRAGGVRREEESSLLSLPKAKRRRQRLAERGASASARRTRHVTGVSGSHSHVDVRYRSPVTITKR